MSTPALFPYRKFRFRLEIEGISVASFSEVTGFDASIDVVEYRDGDAPVMTARKLPGLVKYGNITFKWGLTDNMDMYNWLAAAVTGDVTQKTITITLINEGGEDKASWTCINAWPIRYTAPDFSSTASEVAIETMEVAHEGLTRTA
jgi:phage tail-like protein